MSRSQGDQLAYVPVTVTVELIANTLQNYTGAKGCDLEYVLTINLQFSSKNDTGKETG